MRRASGVIISRTPPYWVIIDTPRDTSSVRTFQLEERAHQPPELETPMISFSPYGDIKLPLELVHPLANTEMLGFLPWPVAVAQARVQGICAIAMCLSAILGVVVFRMASGGLKRVEAKAGPAGLSIDTGN